MSYQVLARKWRPKDFSSLVGQEHVVRALRHALEAKRLHHAYLFTGTRGVGKTTLARILAKCLNCETGVTSRPCGKCSACVEIDAGRFVYVIDEVHQLSGHAFNAMLKTLEEPPEHMKFVLATTDPQKIPVTVLSRCLQFNLKQMPPAAIVAHLEHILREENVPAEPEALALIARAASGSMRDALSPGSSCSSRSRKRCPTPWPRTPSARGWPSSPRRSTPSPCSSTTRSRCR